MINNKDVQQPSFNAAVQVGITTSSRYMCTQLSQMIADLACMFFSSLFPSPKQLPTKI
jgi:hypothetical protein